MLDKSPYQNYQQNAIMTAKQEELTTMLYNRLVRDLKQAQGAVDKKEIQLAHNAITHAQEILAYLMNTLDTSLDVGRNLNLMYDYMYRRLVEANIKKDGEILQEITGYAEEIRNTWVQAVQLAGTGVTVGR